MTDLLQGLRLKFELAVKLPAPVSFPFEAIGDYQPVSRIPRYDFSLEKKIMNEISKQKQDDHYVRLRQAQQQLSMVDIIASRKERHKGKEPDRTPFAQPMLAKPKSDSGVARPAQSVPVDGASQPPLDQRQQHLSPATAAATTVAESPRPERPHSAAAAIPTAADAENPAVPATSLPAPTLLAQYPPNFDPQQQTIRPHTMLQPQPQHQTQSQAQPQTQPQTILRPSLSLSLSLSLSHRHSSRFVFPRPSIPLQQQHQMVPLPLTHFSHSTPTIPQQQQRQQQQFIPTCTQNPPASWKKEPSTPVLPPKPDEWKPRLQTGSSTTNDTGNGTSTSSMSPPRPHASLSPEPGFSARFQDRPHHPDQNPPIIPPKPFMEFSEFDYASDGPSGLSSATHVGHVEQVNTLLSMGFSHPQALHALEMYDYDVNKASNYLIDKVFL
ncbi:hypothetical protein BX661DRAFT_189505 [Kickxella alabastrina]|uniref:uncharacterized protein n=1 Tax=Kickxella alabastrina TaxID=61397 RepID=UPI00221F69BF|nr:uncharacterized protein BX661DRAFT_189505 [Kickxella alabastrina]KAI7820099.1 hypothetical protein BX661DRAFT_189505 [Kickxella alabastrina]